MAHYSDLTIPEDAVPGARPGEFYLCCPKCIERVGKADTGFHLGVSLNKGVFNCFRCGFKGPARNLDVLMMSFESSEYYDDNSKVDGLRKKLADAMFRDYSTNEVVTENIDLDRISYPMTKEGTPIAYSYMLERNFSAGELHKLKLRVGKEYQEDGKAIKKWAGRVLFPFYVNGICEYVIGRAYTDKTPKYLNIVKDKSQIIYNIENVVEGKPCIICEGVISAIAAQRYTKMVSVATLGKVISDGQIAKIRKLTNHVYFSFDGDLTRKEVVKNVKRLLNSGFKVEYVRLPEGKDPDDLRSDYNRYFESSVSPFFI